METAVRRFSIPILGYFSVTTINDIVHRADLKRKKQRRCQAEHLNLAASWDNYSTQRAHVKHLGAAAHLK